MQPSVGSNNAASYRGLGVRGAASSQSNRSKTAASCRIEVVGAAMQPGETY